MSKTAIKKPVAKVIGQDGNTFNLIGICKRALKKVGQDEEAQKNANRGNGFW